VDKRTDRHRRNNLRQSLDALVIRGIIALLALLIMAQSILLLLPHSGKYLNTALRLEGEPITANELVSYAGSVSSAPWAVINLKLAGYTSLPEAKVFINGREAASFQKCEVTLTVKHKDQIAVKNPDPDQIITIFVDKKTPNVQRPLTNSSVSGKGVIYLDSVVVK